MTKLSTILRQQVRPPFDDNDRVSLTPAGEAALDAASAAQASGDALPPGCPRCGSVLGTISLYHGGAGYRNYFACVNPLCDYRRRA